jgi:hypothetical protein
MAGMVTTTCSSRVQDQKLQAGPAKRLNKVKGRKKKGRKHLERVVLLAGTPGLLGSNWWGCRVAFLGSIMMLVNSERIAQTRKL